MIDERLRNCITYGDCEGNFNVVMAIIDKLAENTECTITFNSDGGSSVSPIEVKYNTKATEPEDPTKDGYTFDGWYNGADEYDWDSVVITDLTLKAKWTAA